MDSNAVLDPEPLEFQTRFLYPFFIRRKAVPEATRALTAARSTPWENTEGMLLWQAAEPPEGYREEWLDHSLEFLFSRRQESGCTYLRLNPILTNQWFQGVEIVLPRFGSQPEQRVSLQKTPSIEMFLSNQGVGVVSVHVSPLLPDGGDPTALLTAFNYLLSHPIRKPCAYFDSPHPLDAHYRGKRPPLEKQGSIRPKPASYLPVLSRIGQKGIDFTLWELLEGNCLIKAGEVIDLSDCYAQLNDQKNPVSAYLQSNTRVRTWISDFAANADPPNAEDNLVAALNDVLRDRSPLYEAKRFAHIPLPNGSHERFAQRPRGEAKLRLNRMLLEAAYPSVFRAYAANSMLTPLEAFDLTPVQERLSVYSGVRYGDSADLADMPTRLLLAPTLSALAQIEEPGHAGATPDLPGLSNAILNRRQWAAVGILGAAHLCADQPNHHPFNPMRLQHYMQKYFIAYLLAFLQRLTLQKLMDEANDIALDPDQALSEGIAGLREHFLNFEITGFFAQVSSRAAVHRYYRLCQEGLDVDHALNGLQRAFAEIDARQSDARQVAIAHEMHHTALATGEVESAMNEHLTTVEGVQVKLEVLEVLIFTVYGGELSHLLFSENHPNHELAFYVLSGSAIGFILGLIILRPSPEHFLKHWRRKKRESKGVVKPVAPHPSVQALPPGKETDVDAS